MVCDVGFAVFQLRRYDALADHDSPDQKTVYKWNPVDSGSVGEVYVGSMAQIAFSGSVDWAHDEQLDSGDGGDDAEIIFAKYFQGTEQVILKEGTSLSVILPEAQADWVVKFIWKEVTV